MYLRKVLNFNVILGITLPRELTNVLGLKRGEYVEVFLRDGKTIVIKPHAKQTSKLTIAD